MGRALKRSLLTAVFAPASLLVAASAPDPRVVEPLRRTLYVTVTDGKGNAVTDLTAADFAVKEGGKACEIVKAEPAKARMHLALMVEERLLGDGSVRVGIFEFIKRVLSTAEISLITVGLRNTTVVDYTTSPDALVGALNQLSLNPRPDSNLAEGILDVAKSLEKQKPERPVILAVVMSGGQSAGASANEVLSQLRQSGAGLFSVTLAGFEGAGNAPLGALGDQSGREQILGDGAKQSGGHRVDVPATTSMPKGLQQIADDLSSQYAITCALPAGAKLDKRLSVSVSRRGVSLRAPSAVPDR